MHSLRLPRESEASETPVGRETFFFFESVFSVSENASRHELNISCYTLLQIPGEKELLISQFLNHWCIAKQKNEQCHVYQEYSNESPPTGQKS